MTAQALNVTDVVAYHEPRIETWWNDTGTHINEIRTVSQKPIYLQEPNKYTGQSWLTVTAFLEAPCQAMKRGAAAWTFHTDASAYMNVTDWFDQLKQVERDFMNGLKAKLADPSCAPQ